MVATRVGNNAKMWLQEWKYLLEAGQIWKTASTGHDDYLD